jgi:hypothetical protein
LVADLALGLLEGVYGDGIELVDQASVVCVLVALADLDGNGGLDWLAANMALLI